MEHTFVGGVHRLWVNGTEAGEIYLAAASCGRHGVPVAVVTSDEAGCAEARGLLPGVRTASTKRGLGRHVGLLRCPEETAAEIEGAVRQALEAGDCVPYDAGGPQALRLETKSTEEADAVAELPGWVREDGYLLGAEAPDWASAHRSLLSAFLQISRAPVRDK
jgi:D-amino peptidase